MVDVFFLNQTLISSDRCGWIVQYDPVSQVLLERRQHPSLEGNKTIHLSNFMEGNFGVSAIEGTSSLHYYRVDDEVALPPTAESEN